MLGTLSTIAVLYEAANGVIIAMFLVTYTALLLVLPNFDAGVRYLVPHFLVLGAFAVRGAALIGTRIYRGPMARQVFASCTAVLGVLWCILVPVQSLSVSGGVGVTAIPAKELFAFIRGQTSANAVVAASKYRSVHLFTQRTTIRLPASHSLADIRAWMQSHRVTDVVIKYSLPRGKSDVTDCPGSPLCHNDNRDPDLQEVFRNADFAVFHVSSEKS